MLIKIDIACAGGENTSTYLNKKKFLLFPDWLFTTRISCWHLALCKCLCVYQCFLSVDRQNYIICNLQRITGDFCCEISCYRRELLKTHLEHTSHIITERHTALIRGQMCLYSDRSSGKNHVRKAVGVLLY